MYRAIIPNGSIECDAYERTEHGVDLFENDEFVAFVSYENLLALVDESHQTSEDRGIL